MKTIKSFTLHYDTKFTNGIPKSTVMEGGKYPNGEVIYTMGDDGRIYFESRNYDVSGRLHVLKGKYGTNVSNIIYE